MTIAIHQPNFLPWMGYFFKIANCDHFVYYDTAPFSKKSFTKRVLIHKPYDHKVDIYLNIPAKRHEHNTEINLLESDGTKSWKSKIKAQIHNAYQTAPYYCQLSEIIDTHFSDNENELLIANFNIEIIDSICKLLNIHTRKSKTSDLELTQNKTLANIEICKLLGGTYYLSGYGGKRYQDDEDFQKEGIQVQYTNFLERIEKSIIGKSFYNKSIISTLAYYPKDLLAEVFDHR